MFYCKGSMKIWFGSRNRSFASRRNDALRLNDAFFIRNEYTCTIIVYLYLYNQLEYKIQITLVTANTAVTVASLI